MPNKSLKWFDSACSCGVNGGVLDDATAVWSSWRNAIGSFAISASAVVLNGIENAISGRT
jgi:hypothetical protein